MRKKLQGMVGKVYSSNNFLPVGVSPTKQGKYFARISSKSEETHLGIYETPEEAFFKI